ncbi:protein-glutamate methylesterase/protein-glutamine glutaminase [Paenibacillus flagellatus]|uniref:Protein-glutamate methylesterase/protein-glutamine glutaminase n=1 Tax=Paenibacillus flagellatus TaxID=2211139 RepID=A0A2V5KPG4_9BACL|nr:chemotaxis response regulator protein-glutamate methylesterase [Paenibacillus flagellatus]PYI50386.1 chemotaxis response regulator protein-glutamate methylesterase [Paenibacillus flagellatus]
MAIHRVLVVDDSVFMRKIITDMIQEDERFEVVDTAKNGLEAVEKAKRLKPDVVTLDIEMPEMNGLEALKRIMEDHPVPVVMLSSLTEEGAKETIAALELGAVDFVRKPSGSISLDLFKVKSLLMEKLTVALQTKVSRPAVQTRPYVPPKPVIKPPAASVAKELIATTPAAAHSGKIERLVAIGTSTGGPRALQQVVSELPADFPAPVLIVQHMPPNFTKSLAQRLDATSHVTVVEAEDGDRLRNGVAYIAPGGWHMIVKRDEVGYKIRLTKDEPRSGHRPSVDMLFDSLLPFRDLKRHIVIMTGMGSDGAKGMQALRQAGAVSTIAESSETCVVYGMPRAAAELNCVTHQLPLYQIASKLTELVTKDINPKM